MKHALLAIALIMTALSFSAAHAAKVYSWTDENGIRHFSEHPPKNTKVDIIKPKTGHSEPVNYSSASSSSASTKAPAASLKDPERCTIAKRNLEVLERGGRMKAQSEDGSFYYLSEQEQQDRKEETLIIIKESC